MVTAAPAQPARDVAAPVRQDVAGDPPWLLRLELELAPYMFALACAHLIVLGCAIGLMRDAGLAWVSYPSTWVPIAVAWLLMVAEAALQIIARPLARWRLRYVVDLLLVAIFPPARIAIRRWSDDAYLYVPARGFCRVGRSLQRGLAKATNGPMIVFAICVLPIAAVEFFFQDALPQHPVLAVALMLAVAAVWIAFALEFLLGLGVADDKLKYCRQHWLDLLIIVLPFVAFIRGLRIFSAGRAMNLWRAYRLRGIAQRLGQQLLALLALKLVFAGRSHTRVGQLERLIKQKESELRRLRAEHRYMRRLREKELPDDCQASRESLH